MCTCDYYFIIIYFLLSHPHTPLIQIIWSSVTERGTMFGSFMLKGITRSCVQCLSYLLFIMKDISNDKVCMCAWERERGMDYNDEMRERERISNLWVFAHVQCTCKSIYFNLGFAMTPISQHWYICRIMSLLIGWMMIKVYYGYTHCFMIETMK